MTTSIKLLFDKIMNDPDIIPPSGQKKEDVALAIAQQRAKQSENNRRALNLAKSSSPVKKLFDFIQLEKAARKSYGDKYGFSQIGDLDDILAITKKEKGKTDTDGIYEVLTGRDDLPPRHELEPNGYSLSVEQMQDIAVLRYLTSSDIGDISNWKENIEDWKTSGDKVDKDTLEFFNQNIPRLLDTYGENFDKPFKVDPRQFDPEVEVEFKDEWEARQKQGMTITLKDLISEENGHIVSGTNLHNVVDSFDLTEEDLTAVNNPLFFPHLQNKDLGQKALTNYNKGLKKADKLTSLSDISVTPTEETTEAPTTTERDAGSQTVESGPGPTSEETTVQDSIDKVFAIENKRKEINERGDREYVDIEGHPYQEEKLHPEELPLINEWMGLKGDNQLTVDDNLSHEHLPYLEAWLNSDAHGHDEGIAFFRDPVKRAEFDSVLDKKDYNSVYEAMVTPAKILSGEEKAKSGVSPREKGYTGNDVSTLDFLSTDPDSTSVERKNAKNRLARRNEKIAQGFENDKPVTEDAPTTETTETPPPSGDLMQGMRDRLANELNEKYNLTEEGEKLPTGLSDEDIKVAEASLKRAEDSESFAASDVAREINAALSEGADLTDRLETKLFNPPEQGPSSPTDDTETTSSPTTLSPEEREKLIADAVNAATGQDTSSSTGDAVTTAPPATDDLSALERRVLIELNHLSHLRPEHSRRGENIQIDHSSEMGNRRNLQQIIDNIQQHSTDEELAQIQEETGSSALPDRSLMETALNSLQDKGYFETSGNKNLITYTNWSPEYDNFRNNENLSANRTPLREATVQDKADHQQHPLVNNKTKFDGGTVIAAIDDPTNEINPLGAELDTDYINPTYALLRHDNGKFSHVTLYENDDAEEKYSLYDPDNDSLAENFSDDYRNSLYKSDLFDTENGAVSSFNDLINNTDSDIPLITTNELPNFDEQETTEGPTSSNTSSGLNNLIGNTDRFKAGQAIHNGRPADDRFFSFWSNAKKGAKEKGIGKQELSQQQDVLDKWNSLEPDEQYYIATIAKGKGIDSTGHPSNWPIKDSTDHPGSIDGHYHTYDSSTGETVSTDGDVPPNATPISTEEQEHHDTLTDAANNPPSDTSETSDQGDLLNFRNFASGGKARRARVTALRTALLEGLARDGDGNILDSDKYNSMETVLDGLTSTEISEVITNSSRSRGAQGFSEDDGNTLKQHYRDHVNSKQETVNNAADEHIANGHDDKHTTTDDLINVVEENKNNGNTAEELVNNLTEAAVSANNEDVETLLQRLEDDGTLSSKDVNLISRNLQNTSDAVYNRAPAEPSGEFPTANNPFPHLTAEYVNNLSGRNVTSLNKLKSSGRDRKGNLKGDNPEVGEYHALFNNSNVRSTLDTIMNALPIDLETLENPERLKDLMLSEVITSLQAQSKGKVSIQAIQNEFKERLQLADLGFTKEDNTRINLGLASTTRNNIEERQDILTGDLKAERAGLTTDPTSSDYPSWLPKFTSNNSKADAKKYRESIENHVAETDERQNISEHLQNTYGDNEEVQEFLANPNNRLGDMKSFTDKIEQEQPEASTLDTEIQTGTSVAYKNNTPSETGAFPDPYSKASSTVRNTTRKKYQALYNSPELMSQLGTVAENLRAGMPESDRASKVSMGDEDYVNLLLHDAILKTENKLFLKDSDGKIIPNQKVKASQVIDTIKRSVADTKTVPNDSISKYINEDGRTIDIEQTKQDNIVKLNEMGFILNTNAKNVNPELAQILTSGDVNALDKFTNREYKYHQSDEQTELHQRIEDSNLSASEKRQLLGARSNKTHAEKLKSIKEHESSTKNEVAAQARTDKEERAKAAVVQQYSDKNIKDRAASILASQIDPDISVKDASDDYKEIHELMSQHGHLLSAAQKKGLTSRADSLRNNYNAHTDTTDAAVRKHTQNEERIRAELVDSGEYTNNKELEAEVRRRGYLGSQEYENDKVNENHSEAASAAQTSTRTNTQQQNLSDALDEHVHGQEGRDTRARESDVGGYDKLIHADENGKVSHTTLLGKNGNYKVQEDSGTSQAHAEHYAEMSGNENATNKYDADAVDSRALSMGHNPEIASDALKSQAAKEYMQAAHEEQTAPDNSVEKRQAQTTMRQIGEEHPEVLQAFSELKSKADQEQERIDNCQPPSPAPISKTTGMALVWACGIHHWVLPENLQGTQDSMGDGGKYLTGQQFQDHMQGDVHMNNDGDYTDADGNVLQDADGNKVQMTTDNSHDFSNGGVYISGSGLFGTNWNDPDSDAPLSNRDAIKHALGRSMKNIFGHDSDASLHGASPTIEKDDKGNVLNHDAFHSVGDHETDHTGVHDSRKNRTQSGQAHRDNKGLSDRQVRAKQLQEEGLSQMRQGFHELLNSNNLTGSTARGLTGLATKGIYIADLANRIANRAQQRRARR